jgi:hypothetical protein
MDAHIAVGRAMGLILRTSRDRDTPDRKAEAASPGERTEHLLRPVSAGLVVLLFALLAAGASISVPALADVFALAVLAGIGPPRRYYQVTDKGQLALSAVLQEARRDARFTSLIGRFA